MIKAKAEVSPKKLKPVLELLYGRKIRVGLVLNIIVLLIVIAAAVIFGRPLLQSAYYSILKKDIPYLLLLIMLFIVMLDLVVGCTKRIITALMTLLKIRKTDGQVTGTQEYEFGENGIFSRAKRDGFLCERFSVYSTVDSVTEYKDNFIVQTRGNIGVFDFTDLCEGDADKLRELLRAKLGERFRVRK